MRRGLFSLLALVLAGTGAGACGGASGTVVTGSSVPDTEYEPSGGVVMGEWGTIPAGTEIWLELTDPLSIRHNRVGDRFEAHVSQELRDENGSVLLPRGARVEGMVVQLRPGYADEPAAIGLRLDSLFMGGGYQRFAASIVRTEVPGVHRVRGRDVLIGAVAGAVLGGIIEGGEGALVGGALGAGGGALISLGRGEYATDRLPRGTDIAVRLDRPIRSLAAVQDRHRY